MMARDKRPLPTLEDYVFPNRQFAESDLPTYGQIIEGRRQNTKDQQVERRKKGK